MQIFFCPFCGPRNEREFSFAGEVGKTRPDTTQAISDADWADYLYSQRKSKGHVREVWMHMFCAEIFIMERNSETMEVIGTTALRKEHA